MPGKVELLGAKELLERFRELDERVATKYVDEALQAGVDVVYDAILRAAPRRSGALQGAIHKVNIAVSRDRVIKAIVIDPRAYYWRFVEFGHRIVGHRPKRVATGAKTAALNFIRKPFKNRKGTARATVRDTFRDLMLGFGLK
jgi:HK97 gp10 family phage protein